MSIFINTFIKEQDKIHIKYFFGSSITVTICLLVDGIPTIQSIEIVAL